MRAKGASVHTDRLITDIAHYVMEFEANSDLARETARYCIMDALGCAILALNSPACTKLLGPLVPNAEISNGARVPGTDYQLDPVQAAFNIGTMIRWLDFNDTWLAAEWGHPSDNLGGILATADYLSRTQGTDAKSPLLMADVVSAMIKAYEIQGVIALRNSFNRRGLDHVLLVRVASSAVVTWFLGGRVEQIANAVSNAWVDGAALRVYRHAPNTGSRKSWAAGDATSRAVRLALLSMRSEMGYASALSAEQWGFYDVLFDGKPFEISQEFGSYVIENILFKVLFPAEFHAQTAVEAGIKLHQHVVHRLDDIARVVIHTQEPALRIIDKTGPLHNPADRDHCLQYMLAISLIFGELNADHYEDAFSTDQRIDLLRAKMELIENKRYSRDYLDPEKRSIANAVQVFFADGTATDRVEIEYPLGHPRRRGEGLPLLVDKCRANLTTRLPQQNCRMILALCQDQASFEATPVHEFVDLFIT